MPYILKGGSITFWIPAEHHNYVTRIYIVAMVYIRGALRCIGRCGVGHPERVQVVVGPINCMWLCFCSVALLHTST
uniref:Uncharacterized protein n=1 Tax=Arundo donax TaxID=35708 RepID=A0A0A9A859_ARUDO